MLEVSIGILGRFLPDRKSVWRDYTRLATFSMIQVLMFSINGFIDNFMVGNTFHDGMVVDGVTINAAQASELNGQAIGGLGAFSQWWFLVSAVTTYAVTSVGFFTAQYYGKGQMQVVKQTVAMKFQATVLIVAPFAIAMLVIPETVINVFSHKGEYNGQLLVGTHVNPAYTNVIAGEYARFAAISWIPWCVTICTVTSQKDLGDPRGGAVAMAFTLATHVGLNAAFIYGAHLGVVGTAYAIIVSRFVNQGVLTAYTIYRKMPVGLWSLYLFKGSRELWMGVAKRWQYPLLGVAWSIAIVMRAFWWYDYFPGDKERGIASADTVLGIAGAIQNIFLVAIDGISPIFSKYVGQNLGKNQIAEARKHALSAIGFGVLISVIISIILVGVAFAVPEMTTIFDVNGYDLEQAKWCILVVALVYPSWTILNSIRTVMSTGGKPGLIASVDGVSTWMQAVWVLALGNIQISTGAFDQFALAYLCFFVTDIVKLIPFIFVFRRVAWYQNITDDRVATRMEQKTPAPEQTEEQPAAEVAKE